MKLFKKKKSRYEVLLDEIHNSTDIGSIGEKLQKSTTLFKIESLKIKLKNHKFLILLHSFNFCFNSFLLLFMTNEKTSIITTVLRVVVVLTAGFVLVLETRRSKKDKVELAKEMLINSELCEEN
jgi:hypothetical protein